MVFAVLLAGLLWVHFRFTSTIPREESAKMEQAVSLTLDWFNIIKEEKELRGISSDARTLVPHSYMIGDDFTFLTTTLGSLHSKEVSTNPDFAALMVRLLHEAGTVSGERAGVIISGSFPALAVSTLAALQIMDMDVIMLSSVGSSAYGANQPGATWIDMENWLLQKGEMHYQSALISAGAENDRGEGILDEGMELISQALDRNQRELYTPGDLVGSIRYKTDILEEAHITVLINIGGSQPALGGCVHASTLPNGLQRNLKLCRHEDRGILQEINARGIPVINLLNIPELAIAYGIDAGPGSKYSDSNYLYTERESNRWAVTATLTLGILALGILLRNSKKRI